MGGQNAVVLLRAQAPKGVVGEGEEGDEQRVQDMAVDDSCCLPVS